MPQALSWLTTAQDCFADDYGSLTRGLLTSVFNLVTGIKRVFHLQDMDDAGFALLTGGQSCPTRQLVGAWRRHLPWYEVDAFCRRTFPWHLITDRDALVSYDEHSVPRWTRKYHIRKGYVTTRNKYMRCEKLFYSYDVERKRYLALRATPGNLELRDLAIPSIEQVSHEDPGVCKGAPAKEIRLAETATTLKDETEEEAIRTIICREIVAGPKKDRWHPLYTTGDAEPHEVLTEFRKRQHHEQSYRVGKHDEFMDAVPNGYNKESLDRKRPGFQRGPIQMIGWLVALVYNAVADFADGLTGDYVGSHVDTLRRKFFNRPGRLYSTPEALIVYLDPFAEQESLLPHIDRVNAEQHRLPWLDNRRLVISVTPGESNGPSP
jgi:hypothetical protein